MSALTHLLPAAVAPVTGDGGWFDWAETLNSDTQNLLKGVAITLGIVFVIIAGVKSHGSMARIIIAAFAAGIFVWVVWNITSVKDKVGNDINALAPPEVVATTFMEPASILPTS